MWLAHRVAGNSGALKAVIIGPRDAAPMGFVGGLLVGGAAMGALRPSLFEAPPAASAMLLTGGFIAGAGTYLGNGCTSGHGLCGISRFSPRSLVAVPVFMGAAVLSSTVKSGVYSIGSMVPLGATPEAVITLAARLAIALVAALVPAVLLKKAAHKASDAYAGLWTGFTFAVGLSIGGMVNGSIVNTALAPEAFNPTLWALFMTALVTTFACYRVVELTASDPVPECRAGNNAIDTRLIGGAALFGIGWGITGFCPGPLVVTLGALPGAVGPLLCFAGVCAGQFLTSQAF